MILLQTKNFNIFPGSVQASSIIGILSSFCSRYEHTYIQKETFESIDYNLKFQILAESNA